MVDRFLFRQVQADDLAIFLSDGEIRAKNHPHPQYCHQASYQQIVNRRGTGEFAMPLGGVVNDYVPFYFSPKTSYTYTIFRGNVPILSPQGVNLGRSNDERRIFIVCKVMDVVRAHKEFCFSDFPLNSMAPKPTMETDVNLLDTHVHWDVFDEEPLSAKISEIGYAGVCSHFANMDRPPHRQLRSQKRMAEFLVKKSLALDQVACIITKTSALQVELQSIMDAYGISIPIYVKRECYF